MLSILKRPSLGRIRVELFSLCILVAAPCLTTSSVLASSSIYIVQTSADIFYLQGERKFRQGNYPGAISDFSKAIRARANFAEAYAYRGLAHHKNKQLENAIKDFQKAIALQPRIAVTYYNLALAQSEVGRIRDAIDSFSKAIEINPRYSDAFYQRGFLRGETNDIRGAIADYNEAIKLNSKSINARTRRGLIRTLYLGDILAAEDFQDTLQGQPQTAESFFNRATAYENLGFLERALQDFTKAIELEPTYVRALVRRAGVRYRLNDTKNAIEDLKRAATISPDDSLPYSTLGLLLYSEGNLDESLKNFSKAIQLDEDNSHIYYLRGSARLEGNNYRGAMADFNTAIQINPDFAIAYFDRGFVRWKLGDREGAIEDIKKAIQLSENFANAYLRLGLFYQEINQQANANANLDKAIQLASRVIDSNPINTATPNAYAYQIRYRARQALGNQQGALADESKYKQLTGGLNTRFILPNAPKIAKEIDFDARCFDGESEFVRCSVSTDNYGIQIYYQSTEHQILNLDINSVRIIKISGIADQENNGFAANVLRFFGKGDKRDLIMIKYRVNKAANRIAEVAVQMKKDDWQGMLVKLRQANPNLEISF